jgi:hypothetical protein
MNTYTSSRQDTNHEAADLTRAARRISRLQKLGICTHGWMQGLTCRDCGREFSSSSEHMAAREEALS